MYSPVERSSPPPTVLMATLEDRLGSGGGRVAGIIGSGHCQEKPRSLEVEDSMPAKGLGGLFGFHQIHLLTVSHRYAVDVADACGVTVN